MMTAEEITARLARLRLEIEDGCGEPAHGLDLNAACVLYDVCQALGLGDNQIEEVLGREAFEFVVGEEIPLLGVPALAMQNS